jgi:NAD(P)H-hydrate epimerase
MESSDLARWPRRSGDTHKWEAAVWLVGGSVGMTGSISLAATAAFRAGAGYVTISIPGAEAASATPIEAVVVPVGEAGRTGRHRALVVGPGLRDPAVAGAILDSDLAAVVDAGAIGEFTPRQGPTVLTPHDGEFERLFGHRADPDRIEAARNGASAMDAVVLLKGPTTVIADPGGAIRLVTDGDARLATAGTGDVLSGVIGAGLALGLDPFEAAGLGAQLHAAAATSALGLRSGLMASDLPDLVAATLDA